MLKISIIILIFIILGLVSPQIFVIDLDLPPNQRYTQVSSVKRQSISNFIQYLAKNTKKYKIAFKFASRLSLVAPHLLKKAVGNEFYQECESIAKGANLPISDIIVFNYMYELGAATDFCTAITVSSQGLRLLGRNLDYGYQQYLANNSVHFKYIKNGQVILQTLGHAGFIGTHTVLKKSTKSNPYQFAITLNQRVQGGLHKTLQKIMGSRCQTVPYALMRTMRNSRGGIQEVIKTLNNMDTCAATYWTILSKDGGHYVIQKNRGVGSHSIRQGINLNENTSYIVQTNHDFNKPDPDNRSTIATAKLINIFHDERKIGQQNIWQILTQYPNFNKLTLMSGLIDVQNGIISHKIWQ